MTYIHPSRSVSDEESETHVESFAKKKKEEQDEKENEAEIFIWAFPNSAKIQITKVKFWTIILIWKAVIKSPNSQYRIKVYVANFDELQNKNKRKNYNQCPPRMLKI